MPWDFDYMEDGDAADSNNINAPFISARTWINAMTPGATRDGTFNHHHAITPSFVGAPIDVVGDHGEHTYAWSVFGAQMKWANFGADGLTERFIIGAAPASGPYIGVGPAMQQLFPGFKVGMANGDGCHGLLVHAGVEVGRLVRPTASDPVSFVLGIQVRVNGNWYTVDESEMAWSMDDRRISFDDRLDLPVATWCFIDADEVDKYATASTDDITGIRMVGAVENAGDPCTVILQRCRLSAIPWFAEGF